MPYAIGCYDAKFQYRRTGHVQGESFATLAQAESRAKELNGMPHAPGRVYAPFVPDRASD